MRSYLLFMVGTLCGFVISALLLGAERGEMENELACWRERCRLLLWKLDKSARHDATIDFPGPGSMS
ncbi:MAG: hypothetical protein P4L43_14405 [Syntrophobacteraceae bacterium]|nr:hypothetical protein [Syntrophobacteraceae bacterium]